MTNQGISLLILSIVFVAVTAIDFYDDLRGDYCRARRPRSCCPGRDDYCTMPILDTVCYCDIFCNRTNGDDCCPDFWEHCLGVRRPTPQSLINPYCYEGNAGYTVGHKVKRNCNTCECRKTAPNKFEFVCENKPCLVQPKLNDVINRGNYGWRASNYSFFWGRTLEYGIRYRLGTFKPYRETMHMNEIRTLDRRPLPESFDSRRRWPRMIQDIRDQGECGSSWAFSTSALASDRRAIQSRGRERLTLSPQHLVSCNTRGQQGCEGGHIDRAWWFLRNQGLTSEQCYPYTSGHSGKKGLCRIPRGRHKRFRCPSGIRGVKNRSTPPYRVGPSESDIMHEIYKNGPVQATFRVMQDFFSYASGIYRKLPLTNTNPSNQGWHSVRIIGWGVEKRGDKHKKYWICANSWGSGWGEDGYFRIIRGQNECDIETFVVGVWAKRNSLRRTNAG